MSCLLQQTQILATSLNTVSTVTKITRCSELGPVLADHLSKGNKDEFNRLHPAGPNREFLPRPVPEPLVRWIRDPKVDHNLGRKILLWMRENGTAPAVVVGEEWSGEDSEWGMMDMFDLES